MLCTSHLASLGAQLRACFLRHWWPIRAMAPCCKAESHRAAERRRTSHLPSPKRIARKTSPSIIRLAQQAHFSRTSLHDMVDETRGNTKPDLTRLFSFPRTTTAVASLQHCCRRINHGFHTPSVSRTRSMIPAMNICVPQVSISRHPSLSYRASVGTWKLLHQNGSTSDKHSERARGTESRSTCPCVCALCICVVFFCILVSLSRKLN